MPRCHPHLSRQRPGPGRTLAIALALTGIGLAESVSFARQHSQVLVLFSTRRDAPISVVADRELPHLLERGLPGGVDYFSEYIDVARIPTPGYQAAFSEFLGAKYKGRRFDLVVAVQDAAVEFLGTHREELFPGTPIVFLAMSPPGRDLVNSTGIVVDADLAGTLALALELQPEIRHVFVVSGASVPDKGYDDRARAQLRRFESRLSINYLSGLPTKDLEARLAALPRQSIVYYLVAYQDGAGTLFSPLKYLDRIVAVANAPTYSWSESTMDHGIVGGRLLGQQAMVEAVAGLSLRVLQGTQAGTIPTSSPDLTVSQVDWRQLRRWGISEARVPEGTQIRFREPGVWQRYKVYVLGAFAVLLAQSALIAGLLLQRSRRRQAEEKALGSEAQLRSSYRRIRDLGARLLSAQETERARIARELHDDISQQLALLEIDLELLSRALPADSEGLADEALSRSQAISRSVHDLSHRLHPARLRLIGLVAAIQGLQQELTRADVAVTFTHEGVPPNLPLDLTLSLYRVLQEGLQNALKYSGAKRVSVHLSGGGGQLVLSIVDDGVGFDVQAAWGKGLGLISIGERLEPFGGSFEVRSEAGKGTHLVATVPLPSSRERDTALPETESRGLARADSA